MKVWPLHAVAVMIISALAIDSAIRGNTEAMLIQLAVLIIPVVNLVFTFGSKVRL